MKTLLRSMLTGMLMLMNGASFATGGGVIDVYNVGDLVSAMELAQTRVNKPTVINVHAGTYELATQFDSPHGVSALPVVQTKVTLVGDGRDSSTLSARYTLARHFTVQPGGFLTIRRLTLRDGGAEGQQSRGGGAIGNFGGAVALTEARLTANYAYNGEEDGLGGAILNDSGQLTISDSEVSHNTSYIVGGAIAVLRGQATITRSFLSDNKADELELSGYAGAIYVGSEATVIIRHSTVSNNSAGEDLGYGSSRGGGILSHGSLRIENSSVTGNTAMGSKGSEGGGLFVSGRTTIMNSTIAGNTSDTYGGGIFNEGLLKIVGSTITRNIARGSHTDCFGDAYVCGGGGGLWNEVAGAVTLTHTVLALNTSHGSFQGVQYWGPDCTGTPRLIGYNLIGDRSQCAIDWRDVRSGHTNLLNIDPLLDDLTESGVPGRNVARPLSGSPVIDAGAPLNLHDAGCLPRDQVGTVRRDGNLDGSLECDIGAKEKW